MEALMFDRNLERLAEFKREDALKYAARERMLREAGILKGLGIRGFFADMSRGIRSFFSRSRDVVTVNRRDLTPCPECA
jgi:hypothetical protein